MADGFERDFWTFQGRTAAQIEDLHRNGATKEFVGDALVKLYDQIRRDIDASEERVLSAMKERVDQIGEDHARMREQVIENGKRGTDAIAELREMREDLRHLHQCLHDLKNSRPKPSVGEWIRWAVLFVAIAGAFLSNEWGALLAFVK